MTVLLIRANRNTVDRDALMDLDLDSLTEPYLAISPVPNSAGARRLLDALDTEEPVWLVITSHNALTYWHQQCPPGELEALLGHKPEILYGAIGQHTASALGAFGVSDVVVPSVNDSRSLADLIAGYPPSTVVVPGGNISMKSLPQRLVPEGFEMVEEVFYATTPVNETPRSVELIAAGDIDTVVLRSPSAARSFCAFNPRLPEGFAVVCTGETTAAEARRLGVAGAIVTTDPTPETVAKTIASLPRRGPRS
jgi:uroporphyrinogen-III synthase